MSKLIENSITVRVSKTIQERAYEPLQISIEETRTFPNAIRNPKKVRKNLYEELSLQLDELLDERLNK
jgi:hypothetical protein